MGESLLLLEPCPVYYNEHNPEKAEWLRQLMELGVIAKGRVDERDIQEVVTGDVSGRERAHFFAGIGVWDYALHLAGWPREWPIWTASCPCQPFSTAGKRRGHSDSRDLWPELLPLIVENKFPPHVIIGEQVSSRDGLGWFDVVSGDLERAGYAVGAVDSCSAGVGAPHIRQRLYWCAIRRVDGLEYAQSDGREQWRAESGERGVEHGCGVGRVAHAECIGHNRRGSGKEIGGAVEFERLCDAGWVGDAKRPERRADQWEPRGYREEIGRIESADWLRESGAANGFWRDAAWVLTRPQRLGDPPSLRPIAPGPCTLANGPASYMGQSRHPGFPLAEKEEARRMRLHGYGDAINARQAAVWVRCVMEELLNGW